MRSHLLVSALALSLLPGCILVVPGDDDDDAEPPVNAPPLIVDTATGWECYQDATGWVFEFETRVTDADGSSDVVAVGTTVFAAGFDDVLDEFDLFAEGGGAWGALVYEDESNLICGEGIDVLFEAVDSAGAADSLFLAY